METETDRLGNLAPVASELKGPHEVPMGDVAIDIKPGNEENVVNPKSNGKLKVAILSAGKVKGDQIYYTFDAPNQVDPKSLTFGLKGYEKSLASVQKQPQDFNGDGLDDLVCFFHTDKTQFEHYLSGKYKETLGRLRGRYSDGTTGRGDRYLEFYAVDHITVVPANAN
ncbi:hypothetical protein ACFLT7_07150 [candidate division KSB1 bacterium]